MRGAGQPAHTLGLDVVVEHVPGVLALVGQGREHVVDVDLFVAPLGAVIIEKGGGVHLPGRTAPVETEGQGQPAGLRPQFFLTHVVGPAAAALADAATHDQHVDQAPVVHVHVVPVVHGSADDDHGLALGLVGIVGELAGHLDYLGAVDAGDFFLPGGGVGHAVIVVAGGDVVSPKAAVNGVVGHGQVVDRGDLDARAVRQGDLPAGHVAVLHAVPVLVVPVLVLDVGEVGEGHGGNIVAVAVDQGELQFDLLAFAPLAGFDVPLAAAVPAVADAALGRYQPGAVLVVGDGFPLAVIGLAEIVRQVAGAQEAGGAQAVAVGFEGYQHRHVGVAAYVVGEVFAGIFQVEFLQDDVAKGHGDGGVGTLLGVEPGIGQLGGLGKVRGDDHALGALVAHFGKEVGVRGAGLGHVGAPQDQVVGVVPVSGLGHVGLLAPDHGGGRRQVAVPVVKAHAHAADQ